ncbi:hypothetical protein AB0C42_05250 [Micromonospora taraxaci]
MPYESISSCQFRDREQHGAGVPHHDADYDRISAVTGQPTEWVAPKGSL